MLPRWLRYNSTSTSTSATLFGVPLLSDLGKVTMFFDKGELISVEVVEETENPCAALVTNWMEFHYPKNVTDESHGDLRDLLYAIAGVVNETDVTKLRVLPRFYLSRHRSGRYTLEDTSLLGGPDQLVVTYPLYCGELDNNRVDEIVRRMPNDYSGVFQSFAGRVVPADRLEPAGRMYTTIKSWKGSQQMNSLRTVKCIQGILCFHPVPGNKFYDAGDDMWDDITKLSLSTHVIGDHSNFLHAVSGRAVLVGVPLDSGSFTFRLDARARANQTRSSQFRVDVVEYNEAPNHEYQLRLFTKAEELKKPENIVVFVILLTEALKKRDLTSSNDLRIHDVSADSNRTAIVKWSYAPLYNGCNLPRINNIFEALNSGVKEIQVLLLDRIGAELKPNQASLKLLGDCAAPAASSSPGSPNESDADAAIGVVENARNHGERTSFEDFLQSNLTWLTVEQKEELRNITLEYFDKIEAKSNEFGDALKTQIQKMISRERTRLFGVTKASGKRCDQHEGNHGLEEYLKTYLSWLTEEQKEELRTLKTEGKSKVELQAKVLEYYDAATGETKKKATESLKCACRRQNVEEYGTACKRIFGMGSSRRRRQETDYVSGDDSNDS